MRKLTLAAALAATLFTTGASFAAVIPGGPSTGSVFDSQSDCGADMGYLRFIRKNVVQSMAPSRITVLPVCENNSLSDNVDTWHLFQNGNVGGLRSVIADNGHLAGALDARNYGADDVVGMRINNNDSVILYVHKR